MDNRPSVQQPPSPWTLANSWAVGGLYQVGFAPESDLLLVLSSQGRGVFDCLMDEKIARDYDDENDFFDPIKLIASGFGLLDGVAIRMAGLFGGGLPRSTIDGWFLDDSAPAWPIQTITIQPPSIQQEDGRVVRPPDTVVGDSGACELRAFGFSETGRTFIIASSCQLDIFVR